MHSLRRVLCTLLALLGLAGCLLALGPGPAAATTGPTYFLPPARYHVGKLARLYRGQYVLQSVARDARLSGAAIGIEVNDRGDLYGVGQFYAYDGRGEQTSWVATLYNFHPARNGIMIIDLLAPGGRPLLGRLFVSRTKHGDLVGQITLGPERYSISWRKISAR